MGRSNGRRWIAALLCIVLVAFGTQASRAGTTGAIQGYVSDAGGHPIAGVAVTAASPSGHFTTTSGAGGFYSINGLPLDTYTLTFSKEGYQETSIPGVTTVQDQPSRVNVRISASVKSLGRVTVRGTTSLVQPTVTADTYVINQQRLSDINGTPQDQNGFQAFNSLPGVTTDNFGYPTIRAGAENDVGYELDGVDNTDPITGNFLNAVSLNGARSVQLATGGYDVSEGNTNSGVINEVMKRGTYPAQGQATIRIDGPTFGHELSFDYGGATPNNRFSYYFSFGGQRLASDYGDRSTLLPLELGNTTFTSLNDVVGNFFYHFGESDRDELQFLTNITGETFAFNYLASPAAAPYASNNGNVQASSDPYGLCGASSSPPFPACDLAGLQSSYLTPFPGQLSNSQNINAADTQTFNSAIDKINFKRQLSSSSFIEARVMRTIENWINWYPYGSGSFTDSYQNLQTTGSGGGVDYTNQVSAKNELSFGATGFYYANTYWIGTPSLEPTYEPLEALGCAAAAAALPTPAQQAGGCYIAPYNAALNAALGLSLPTDPAHAPMTTYASDFGYSDLPLHRWDVFAKDRWQPNERLTVTVGVRWDEEAIPIPADAAVQNTTYYIDDTNPAGCGAPTPGVTPTPPPCNVVTIPGQSIGADVTQPQQISPRIAASYEMTPHDTVRFSYGKNIEFVPTVSIVTTYDGVPASLQDCNIADHCFTPLPGYPVTNHVTNLYQQTILDLTTNFFAQYTPVKPQRAINYDFSYEHDFGHGVELRLTPYYRKGTDYVVGNAPLLFLLPSGTPVFGPSKSENAGVNENTGVELALQRNAQYGFSGLVDATYDNTLANYDSDYFPAVNAAALAANHFFHVTYVAPVVGTFNLVYNTPNGFHASTTVSYDSGYRYGVGTKTFVFAANGQPEQVLNTDLAATTVSQAYYLTDPADPGTMEHPNIVASRGTPEGPDPGSLFGPQAAIVNVTLAHDLGKGWRGAEVGIRAENLFGNYSPITGVGNNDPIPPNLYYQFQGIGGYGASSGVNTNACAPGQTFACEPFQYDQSKYPYEKEANGEPRLYTVFLSVKY